MYVDLESVSVDSWSILSLPQNTVSADVFNNILMVILSWTTGNATPHNRLHTALTVTYEQVGSTMGSQERPTLS